LQSEENPEEGRLSYERGISQALSAFRDARSTTDPEIIILVEYTFLVQEFQFCDKTDTDSLEQSHSSYSKF
jgi:hypothetical protein